MQPPSQLSWRSLLITIVLVPLAVGVVPLSGATLMLNSFVQPKHIILALGIGATLLAWVWEGRTNERYVGWPLWVGAAFVAVMAASAAFGIDPRVAVFGDIEQGTGLLAVALCTVALVLVAQLARGEQRVRELTSVAVLTAAGIAVVGLLQQLLLIDVLGIYQQQASIQWMVHRGYGTIGNPDTYAAYLVLPALLALNRAQRASDSKQRWIWVGSFAAIFASCLLAQTRGPLVGLVVGGALLVIRFVRARKVVPAKNSKKKKSEPDNRSTRLVWAVLAGALVIAVVAGLVNSAQTSLIERFGSIGAFTSLGGRLPLWKSAIDIVSAHPLLGAGPDSFRLAWYGTRTIAHLAQGAGLVITDSHGVPFQLAATTGILGLAAFLALLGTALYQGFRRKADEAPDYSGWFFGAVALAVTLLTSMYALVLVFALFVACGVLLAPGLRAASARSNTLALRVVVGALGLALVAFSGVSAIAQLTAAGTRTDDVAKAASSAKRAASLAPWDTSLRDLEEQTLVNSALDSVFSGSSGAQDKVMAASKVLAEHVKAEPDEYRTYYHQSVLLIGTGQYLADAYTTSGIEAALNGLEIYPNSLELRTGLASAYLKLGQPERAVAVLKDVWEADPGFLSSGLSYAQALAAQGNTAEALKVISVLEVRFAGNANLKALRESISSQTGGAQQ